MKKLTWLFKKFLYGKSYRHLPSSPHFTNITTKFSRVRTPRLGSGVALLVSTVAILTAAALSCRIHQNGAESARLAAQVGGEPSPQALTDRAQHTVRLPLYLPTLQKRSGEDSLNRGSQLGPKAAVLLATSCNESNSQETERLVPGSLVIETQVITFGISAQVKLRFDKHNGREVVRADLDGRSVFLVSPTPQASYFEELACANLAAELLATNSVDAANLEASTILTASARDWLLDVLELIAPDCDLSVPDQNFTEWRCNLPQADIGLALSELSGVRSTMIRRWSRQPYLLSRRLAVATSIAHALGKEDSERGLNSLCRIVENSMPQELPAILTSARWRQVVCKGTPNRSVRDEAASFALHQAMAEIDALRRLFEKTSRLGYLTVRVPRSSIPHRTLWVSLTPDTDVTDNLVSEMGEFGHSDDSSQPAGRDSGAVTSSPNASQPEQVDSVKTAGTTARNYANRVTADLGSPEPLTDSSLSPQVCWHPIYSESRRLTTLAGYLTLATETVDTGCQIRDLGMLATSDNDKAVDSGHSESEYVQNYLAASITSETEFALSNGRSKMLRLPIGHYSYRLQSLPDDPDAWDQMNDEITTDSKGDDAASEDSLAESMESLDQSNLEGDPITDGQAKSSRGTILWEKRRPRPVIREW